MKAMLLSKGLTLWATAKSVEYDPTLKTVDSILRAERLRKIQDANSGTLIQERGTHSSISSS